MSATILCSVQGTGVLCQLLYSVLCRGLDYCVSYYTLFCAADWSTVSATILCSVQGTGVLCQLLYSVLCRGLEYCDGEMLRGFMSWNFVQHCRPVNHHFCLINFSVLYIIYVSEQMCHQTLYAKEIVAVHLEPNIFA